MSNVAQWLIIIAVYGIVVVGFVLSFISDPRKRFIVACALFFGGVGTLLVAMAVSIRADNEAEGQRIEAETRQIERETAALPAGKGREGDAPLADPRSAQQEYQRLHPTPYPYLQPTPFPSRVISEQEAAAQQRAAILRKYGSK